MDLPQRKRPAFQPVFNITNRTNIIFVTVCTAHRKSILANDLIHNHLLNTWKNADHWMIGKYLIMPDHIHFFCSPAKPNYQSIKKWITYWKSLSSKNWPRIEDQPVWQLSAWDRQLRSGESYSAKWNYIQHNPVRANLCNSPEEWKYQGELNILHWRE